MAVNRLDIVIPQGGTFRMTVQVIGGPTDITDYTGKMQVRQSKGNAAVLAEVSAGAFTVSNTTRTVTIEIPSTETALYEWDRDAVYDAYIVGPGLDEWRIIEGLARLSKTVTRD
jgi:hypothetical protein